MSIVVILLLLTANFQSVRLALVVVSTTPAVVAGVVLMLWLTGTTLNLQSFMGAIMAIGVAVANAILLVTFAEGHRREEARGGRGGRGRGAPGPAAADPDDQLRHDRRHGADGAGLERRRRADRPAGPGGHRRPGRRDPRHPGRAARPSSRWSRAGPAASRPRSTPTTRESPHYHEEGASTQRRTARRARQTESRESCSDPGLGRAARRPRRASIRRS